jgi:hypothetical protein
VECDAPAVTPLLSSDLELAESKRRALGERWERRARIGALLDEGRLEEALQVRASSFKDEQRQRALNLYLERNPRYYNGELAYMLRRVGIDVPKQEKRARRVVPVKWNPPDPRTRGGS